MAKDDTCGWHVDDQGFWPESYLSSASENSGKDQYGINAWVALDDMPKPFEGSMEVARGSHKAPWRWEAYQAIGQDRTRPGLSKEELFESLRTGKFKQFGTCEGIKSNRADLGETLRESSEIFDLQKGDVIFATRMLFHRTRKVTPEGIEFYKKSGKQVLNRYSVRYVPGTARLLEGFTTEWSILDHPDNAGRSLDEVANDKENEDWYPKVWPVVDEPSVISKTKIDQTRGKEKELMAELMQVMK